jgi:hypothetical protein
VWARAAWAASICIVAEYMQNGFIAGQFERAQSYERLGVVGMTESRRSLVPETIVVSGNAPNEKTIVDSAFRKDLCNTLFRSRAGGQNELSWKHFSERKVTSCVIYEAACAKETQTPRWQMSDIANDDIYVNAVGFGMVRFDARSLYAQEGALKNLGITRLIPDSLAVTIHRPIVDMLRTPVKTAKTKVKNATGSSHVFSRMAASASRKVLATLSCLAFSSGLVLACSECWACGAG